MNFAKMDPAVVKKKLSEGRRHLKFMDSIYRSQLLRGAHLLHEHPATARSWKEPAMESLAKESGVYNVVADQCQYGLVTPSGDGYLPAMKPTRFLTSSPQMAHRLSLRCDKSHTHQPLVGGRCADAAFYPLPLIRAILHGMRDTADAKKRESEAEASKMATLNAVTHRRRVRQARQDRKLRYRPRGRSELQV